MNKPSFYSILIPSVRYNQKLSWFDKIMFSEISALTNIKGFCFANNTYFKKVFNVSLSTVHRSLSNLEKNDCIRIDVIKNDNNAVVERRIFIKIKIATGVKYDITPSVKNDTTPSVKNDTYNNIKKSNNTRFNNNYNKPKDIEVDWLDDYIANLE